jgi:hypothetical protein
LLVSSDILLFRWCGREDGTRTHTGRILSPLPLPLGYLPLIMRYLHPKLGGAGTQIRTGDVGFAIQCLSHLAMPASQGRIILYYVKDTS